MKNRCFALIIVFILLLNIVNASAFAEDKLYVETNIETSIEAEAETETETEAKAEVESETRTPASVSTSSDVFDMQNQTINNKASALSEEPAHVISCNAAGKRITNIKSLVSFFKCTFLVIR